MIVIIASGTTLAGLQTSIVVVLSSLHWLSRSPAGLFIFRTAVVVSERKAELRAGACLCLRMPSASRNAWVPPKLRWLPSTKMAARIPLSIIATKNQRQWERC